MKRPSPFPLLALVLAVGATTAPAAPLTRDLGLGLTYHRAAALPGDLPSPDPARKDPCILDLRYARGDSAAGIALAAWLKFNASARTPVFLLVNADTSPAALAPLAARLPAPGLIVIGPAAAPLTPDLALQITPAEERRAYDALAAGAAVESLLTHSPEKVRHDEARLARDHRGQTAPTPFAQPADDPAPEPPTAEMPSQPAAPLVDLALQRAVHLHRSLKALRKI